MSSCDRVTTDLVAFDRDELAPAEAAAVREHVAVCPACARALAKLHGVADLVARATAIEPRGAASAELRAAVDAALVAGAAPIHLLSLRRSVRGVWDAACARYEQSAGFRRFTLASVGLHAAAALLLAVVLARSPGAPGRAIDVRTDPSSWFPLPGEQESAAVRPATLPAFDATTPDGVVTPAAPGIAFPNRTSALRYGAAATAESRAAALSVALGDDAARARDSLDRGLGWLASQRGADGAFDVPERSVEATAAAVLAFAADGRRSTDDAGLALSVAWLERRSDSGDLAERALALRALTAQYVMDFSQLPRPERLRRAEAIGSIAARVETGALALDVSRRSGPDAAAAIAATNALADVRAAGVRDAGDALAALAGRIEWRRTADGRITGASWDEGVALTASFCESAADVGARPLAETAADALAARVEGLAPASTRHAASGAAALVALGRPVRETLAGVVARQRGDGRWAAGPSPSGADVVETAMGVVALTRTYRR